MPTVEYSPAIASTMYSTFLNINLGQTNNNYNWSLGSQATLLALYSGPVVTSFSASTSTDLGNALCTWNNYLGITEPYGLSNQSFNTSTLIWTITSYYRAARASGTATYFKLLARQTGSTADLEASYPVYGAIHGTVGLIGSGADLEMGNTTIVAGRRYRVQNLQIQFPRTFTY